MLRTRYYPVWCANAHGFRFRKCFSVGDHAVFVLSVFVGCRPKVVLCGSGELGKEFVIELQRYGVEVIALDKYANAPAMQVADRSYVVSMLDGKALREIIEKEKPDYIVPEVEAIATTTLMELEQEGFHLR